MQFRQKKPPISNWVAPAATKRRPAGARLGAVSLTSSASALGTDTAATVNPNANSAGGSLDPLAGTITGKLIASKPGTGTAGVDSDTTGSYPLISLSISPLTTNELQTRATGRDATGAAPVFFANPEAINALVPYLALGFVPQYTETTGNLCALFALATSLRAVRNLNSTTPIQESDHFTAEQLRNLFQGNHGLNEYLDMVEETLADDYHRSLDPVTLKEHKETYINLDNLDVQQIRIMLNVINARLGTNYVLGYITQGYRGGYEKTAASVKREKGTSDRQKAETRWNQKDYVWNDDVHVNTSAILFAGDGRSPVVWIWNDNYQAISTAQTGNTNTIGHWEGLAPMEDDIGAARVASWGLEERIASDVAAGIWRANRDTDLRSGAHLDAKPVLRRGHFVREVNPGNHEAIADSRYVRTCATAGGSADAQTQEGWVLNKDLARVVRAAQVPAHSRSAASVNKNEQTQVRPFTIFRGVPLTNKVGGPRNEHGAQFIDNFNIASGAFFLDNSKLESPDVALVRAIDGKIGRAYRRHLQIVVNPWGLGDRMAVVTGSANGQGRPLPLVRVTRDIPAGESGGTFFLKNEIVLLTGLTPCGGSLTVRDFESARGSIPLDACQTLPPAFGLLFDTSDLDAKIAHLSRPVALAAPLGPPTARKRKADEVDVHPSTKKALGPRGWTNCEIN